MNFLPNFKWITRFGSKMVNPILNNSSIVIYIVSKNKERESHKKESLRQTRSWIDLYPKSQTPDRLHLPVLRAVQIRLRCPNVRMAHQSLNGSEIIPVVQKGRSKGMTHHVGMNPLVDQCLFYSRFDETINGLRGKVFFFIETMLS